MTAGDSGKPPADERIERFYSTLRDDYAIDGLGSYVLLVEGLTDIAYIHAAVACVRNDCGVDLLEVALPGSTVKTIEVVTPTTPRHPDPEQRGRGGAPRLGQLIKYLDGNRWIFESNSRLCFVVDHDEAGKGVIDTLKNVGFAHDYMSLMLDPALHVGACSSSDVVVEDLLSIRIQRAFLDAGGCTCKAHYQCGDVVRIEWDGDSKSKLPEYISDHATTADVAELIRLVCRARQLWGLPISEAVSDMISSPAK